MRDVLITYDETQDTDPMFGYSIKETQEVVRCRECEFHVVDQVGHACTFFDMWHGKPDDGFCAWGIRKG